MGPNLEGELEWWPLQSFCHVRRSPTPPGLQNQVGGMTETVGVPRADNTDHSPLPSSSLCFPAVSILLPELPPPREVLPNVPNLKVMLLIFCAPYNFRISGLGAGE